MSRRFSSYRVEARDLQGIMHAVGVVGALTADGAERQARLAAWGSEVRITLLPSYIKRDVGVLSPEEVTDASEAVRAAGGAR